MIEINMPDYVQWLHTGQNVKLWTAKERAQKAYARQHGVIIPLYKIQSTSEIEEAKKIAEMQNAIDKERL